MRFIIAKNLAPVFRADGQKDDDWGVEPLGNRKVRRMLASNHGGTTSVSSQTNTVKRHRGSD